MDIKIRYRMLFSFFCCLFLIACDSDSATVQRMELGDGAVMLAQHATTREVTVTNGGDWTVSVPNEAGGWCAAQREGDDVLVITVEENTDVNFRETVLIISNESEQKTLPVRQTGTAPLIQFMAYDYTGYPISLAGESQEVLLPYNVTAVEVDVFSNVPYEVITGKNSWVEVATGTDTQTDERTIVRFTVEVNPLDVDRGIEVTFRQVDGDYMALLPVKQRKNLGSSIHLTPEMFTITPLEGAIQLDWIFPEEAKYDKIIFEYDDRSTATEGDKLTREVAFNEGHEVIIDGLLAKYGDFTFNVQILNEDGESLVYNEGGFSFDAGQCLPVQPRTEIVETKIDLSVRATDSNDVDGLKWLSFSGKDAGSPDYACLVDGDISTFWQTENRTQAPKHDYNYIIIQIPDGIECTEFTIKTVNAENQISQAPGLYTVSIGGSADPEATDWELVFEQAPKEWKYGSYSGYDLSTEEHNFGTMPGNDDANRYRYKTLQPMKSQIKDKAIRYIKYAVTDRNHRDPRNDYFKLSEFEVYTIETVHYDPENE